MRLYGLKYNLDDRRLVGFTRDISVITDEQYQAMEVPPGSGNSRGISTVIPASNIPASMRTAGQPRCVPQARRLAPRTGPLFQGFIPETDAFRRKGVDVTISINDKPTEIVNLRAGEFTLTRLIKEATNVTTISLHFSDAVAYGPIDKRPFPRLSAKSRSRSAGLGGLQAADQPKGRQVRPHGKSTRWLIAQSASFNAPRFSEFKVLKIDLEIAGLVAHAQQRAAGFAQRPGGAGRESRARPISESFPSSRRRNPKAVSLAAASVFPLPGEKRERSFLIKNISFENLSPTDLFARGCTRADICSRSITRMTTAGSTGASRFVSRRPTASRPP